MKLLYSKSPQKAMPETLKNQRARQPYQVSRTGTPASCMVALMPGNVYCP